MNPQSDMHFRIRPPSKGPGLELSASAYNLFDEDCGYPGAENHTQDTIPQPGRSLRIKATFRF